MAHNKQIHAVSKIDGFRNFIASRTNAGALLFAALLVVCSITVGCSKDNPQTTSTTQIPVTQPTPTAASSNLPATLPAIEPAKPSSKKAVRKRPTTVTYTDKTSGVSFQYPRKYALETGSAANERISSAPVPMNFVQPGGVALAAVALPDTSYPGTDFDSGMFNISVNRTLTEEQCNSFSVPQSDSKNADDHDKAPPAKLMVGDLELQSVENVAGEGSKQSDAKYFHTFSNGACYEFVLKVSTNGETDLATGKHLDRDRVFHKLEKILSTVKITPAADSEVAATTRQEPGTETAPATSETPTQ